MIRPATIVAIFLLSTTGMWAQVGDGYLEQRQRLAEIHVGRAVSGWLRSTGVPGAAVALVEADQTLLLRGFGLAHAESDTPVDPTETVFQAGELARPLTATALLLLLGSDLDDARVEISGASFPDALRSGRSGAPRVVDLLLHTAGFEDRIAASRARSPEDLLPLQDYLARRLPPRVRPPGLISIPSSHGFALAGLLVEELSGQRFGRYLDRVLLRPLAMADTAAEADARLLARLASGYRQPAGHRVEVPADFPQTLPASFLLTTAADMSRWLQVLLSAGHLEGDRVVDTGVVEELLSPRFTNHDLLPGRTVAFREGSRYFPPELFVAARGNGFGAVQVLLPQARLGLFAAFNSEVDFWPLIYAILDRFATRRRLSDRPPEPAQTSHTPRLAGYWRDAAVSLSTAEKLVSLVRQDRIRQLENRDLMWRSRRFEAIGPVVFQPQGGSGRLCFVMDGSRVRFAATADEVLERLHWTESRPVQATLWVAFAAVFLAAAWQAPPLPRRQAALSPADAFSPRWPMALARLAATLDFLFVVALAIFLARALTRGVHSLPYGISPLAVIVLTLPMVAALLTVVAAAGIALAWRTARWTRRHRLRLVLLVSTLIAFLPFLHGWNLLGIRL